MGGLTRTRIAPTARVVAYSACVLLCAGEMLRALLEKSDKLAERLSAIEQAKEPSHGNRSHIRKSHSHVVKKRSFVDKDGSRVTEGVDDGGKAGGVACVWVVGQVLVDQSTVGRTHTACPTAGPRLQHLLRQQVVTAQL